MEKDRQLLVDSVGEHESAACRFMDIAEGVAKATYDATHNEGEFTEELYASTGLSHDDLLVLVNLGGEMIHMGGRINRDEEAKRGESLEIFPGQLVKSISSYPDTL